MTDQCGVCKRPINEHTWGVLRTEEGPICPEAMSSKTSVTDKLLSLLDDQEITGVMRSVLSESLAEIERLRAELQSTRANFDELARRAAETTDNATFALVQEQAKDEGLWFAAHTAPEAYLQRALRKLHAAVEGESIAFRDEVKTEAPLSEADEDYLLRTVSRSAEKASAHKCASCGAEGEPGSPKYCSADCAENGREVKS